MLVKEGRRQFLVTNLGAGFALAVSPVTAATITTDTEGLEAGEIQIPTHDGGMIPGYRAVPNKGTKHPVVLVVQEIFGVHEHIKDLCRRFAKDDYMAIAPEMYARQGDVSKLENVSEIISKVVSKVPDAQVMSDLDDAVAWAAKSGKADTAKLAITGFCWGGRVVWLYAAHNSKLKAGAAWYGVLAGQKDAELRPKTVIDIAGDLKAPVIGFYGGKDQGITQEHVEQMRAALKAASNTSSEITVYPDAPHGFNADYRPSYREVDAKDAWAKMLAWFKKNGA